MGCDQHGRFEADGEFGITSGDGPVALEAVDPEFDLQPPMPRRSSGAWTRASRVAPPSREDIVGRLIPSPAARSLSHPLLCSPCCGGGKLSASEVQHLANLGLE